MKLSLHTIASLFIIGIGTVLLGVTLPFFSKIIKELNGDFFNEGFGFFLLLGFGFFVAGIMMLLRLKSSTMFTTFILIVAMIGWILFVYLVMIEESSQDEQLILYAFSLFIFIFLLVLTLFVNNDKVQASKFTHEQELGEDILDRL